MQKIFWTKPGWYIWIMQRNTKCFNSFFLQGCIRWKIMHYIIKINVWIYITKRHIGFNYWALWIQDGGLQSKDLSIHHQPLPSAIDGKVCQMCVEWTLGAHYTDILAVVSVGEQWFCPGETLWRNVTFGEAHLTDLSIYRQRLWQPFPALEADDGGYCKPPSWIHNGR